MHVHTASQTHRADRWSGAADPRIEARAAHAKQRHGDDHDERRQMDGGERAGRRNPLVSAMMQALQALTQPTATAGQPASAPVMETTEPVVERPETAVVAAAENPAAADVPAAVGIDAAAATETTNTTNTTRPVSLKEAAAAFAHELFSALRDDAGDNEGKRSHGHHHHFGHHHGHGWGHRGGGDNAYANLAQRLETLAAKFAPPQPAAATPPAATLPAVEAPAAALPTVDAPATTGPVPAEAPAAEPVSTEADSAEAAAVAAPAAGSGISINVNINIQINVGGAPASTSPVSATAPSPLLAAFETLLSRLQGASGGTGQGDSASASDKLREFLLGIAGNLKTGRAGGDEAGLRPAAGSLIDVAA